MELNCCCAVHWGEDTRQLSKGVGGVSFIPPSYVSYLLKFLVARRLIFRFTPCKIFYPNHVTCPRLPLGHLSGLMSTAIIRAAPDSLQPMMTARPTAPHPQTATLLPCSTLAVFSAAPYPGRREDRGMNVL